MLTCQYWSRPTCSSFAKSGLKLQGDDVRPRPRLPIQAMLSRRDLRGGPFVAYCQLAVQEMAQTCAGPVASPFAAQVRHPPVVCMTLLLPCRKANSGRCSTCHGVGIVMLVQHQWAAVMLPNIHLHPSSFRCIKTGGWTQCDSCL